MRCNLCLTPQTDHVCIHLFKIHLDLVLPVKWSHKHWQQARQGHMCSNGGWEEKNKLISYGAKG